MSTQIPITDIIGLPSPVGAAGQFLQSNGTVYVLTASAGSGNVSNTGTPTSGQLAGWVSAFVIQGITLGTNLSITGTTLNATGGSPGGSTGQVQYNASGLFAGGSGFITDSSGNVTVRTLTSQAFTVSTTIQPGNYQLTSTDFDVAFTGNSPTQFSMPSSPTAGQWFRVSNMGSAVLTLSSSNNFFSSTAGNSTITLSPGNSVDLTFINSTWKVQ